jgi:hypothetical protein
MTYCATTFISYVFRVFKLYLLILYFSKCNIFIKTEIILLSCVTKTWNLDW